MTAALDPNCLPIPREVDRIAISLQVVSNSKHSAISVAWAWQSRIVESAVSSDFRVWGAKVKSSKIRYEVVRYLSIESKVCLLAGKVVDETQY